MKRFQYFVLALGLSSSACSLALNLEPGKLPGEVCAERDECLGETAVCQEQQCVLSCAGPAECPDGTTCLDGRCASAGAVAFGDVCAAATECSTGLCEESLCLSRCAGADADCPNGARCVDLLCQPEFRAGFIFDATVSSARSGFAYSHEVGRTEVESRLPWLQTFTSEGNSADTVNGNIDELVDDDVDVLFVTSSRFASQGQAKAVQHSGTKFFTYASSNEVNHVGYAARFHQAWYIAGQVAAKWDRATTQAGTIGFVAPIAVPQVIRELNAFALGARSVDATIDVEVIWAAGFVPSDAVTDAMVDYLVAGGNRIIVNRLGSDRINRYVATATGTANLYSIGVNNIDACQVANASTTCLGSVYWNWAVMYEQIIRSVRSGQFSPGAVINLPIAVDPNNSSFSFALNSNGIPALSTLAESIPNTAGALVSPTGADLSLVGPYQVTVSSQRTPPMVLANETIDDDELNSMCWLVQGIVQRSDPEDPLSATIPAPAPDGLQVWPPRIVDPNSIAFLDCDG